MKDKEAAAIGCVIGMCALVSRGCNLARSILCKLNELWENDHMDRGEERGPEGASEGGEHTADRRGEGEGK